MADPDTEAERIANLDAIRLLISDTDPANQTFTDTELGVFLDLEAGSVRRGAAQALDTIASNEALVSKVITTQDLSTDGAKLAQALQSRAESLRAQDDEYTERADGSVLVVDFDPTYGGFGPELT